MLFRSPVDPYEGPNAGAPRGGHRGMNGQRGQGGQRGQRRQRMRAKLIARFDRNGDGRLTGPERVAAKRFVMRVRMMRQMRQQQRGQRDF